MFNVCNTRFTIILLRVLFIAFTKWLMYMMFGFGVCVCVCFFPSLYRLWKCVIRRKKELVTRRFKIELIDKW